MRLNKILYSEQISPSEDELNKEVEEILDEESDNRQVSEQTEIYEMEKDNENRVMSFDDLISKYKIDTVDVFGDSPAEMNVNAVSEPLSELKQDPIHEPMKTPSLKRFTKRRLNLPKK